jgi:UPF0716 protein FxsA
MIFVALVALPAIEIWLALRVADWLGDGNTLLLLALEFFLGLGIARSKGQRVLARAQAAIAEGRPLDGPALQDALGVAGGLLIAFPGFFSDVLGLALLLPGLRAISARALRGYVERQVRSGRVRVFAAGTAGPFANAAAEREQAGPRLEREATGPGREVIDVVPIASESHKPRGPRAPSS